MHGQHGGSREADLVPGVSLEGPRVSGRPCGPGTSRPYQPEVHPGDTTPAPIAAPRVRTAEDGLDNERTPCRAS